MHELVTGDDPGGSRLSEQVLYLRDRLPDERGELVRSRRPQHAGRLKDPQGGLAEPSQTVLQERAGGGRDHARATASARLKAGNLRDQERVAPVRRRTSAMSPSAGS